MVVTQMESPLDPGPIQKSLLYDQDNHITSAIWDGQERGVLRCHEHTSMLEHWKLTPRQTELVEKAGFGYFTSIPTITLDNSLISALVERWRRETNTFHLPVGEMTITLEDVALILGLPIDGSPVIGPSVKTPSLVCEQLLGKAPKDLNGGMLKLNWLRECFSKCPDNASVEETERHTRAYLLYLVGCTIFSTTTGNKVSVSFLTLFENFDEAGRYAWGAAALAFLYRALGNASLKSQGTISGSLTLLQCWSYYHLNIGQPKFKDESDKGCFPFALRWKGRRSSGTRSKANIIAYRNALDSLQYYDVRWCPYKDLDPFIPEDIKNNLILRTSKTMLICFGKAERHFPDRCLRQFGMLQSIPVDVERWERKIPVLDQGLDLSKEMEVDSKGKLRAEIREWLERGFYIVEEEEGTDESEYMEWYENITRKYVGRPESLESEFQRIVSAMRDIENLANSFPIAEMGFRDRNLLDEVKSTLYTCLNDLGNSKKGRSKNAVKRKREGG